MASDPDTVTPPDAPLSYRRSLAPPVLIVADAVSAADAVAAAGFAGGRILATIDWSDPLAVDRHAARPVLLVETLGIGDARLAKGLPRIADHAATLDLPIVAALGEDQIDIVSAHLLGARAQLLCTPTIADRIVALSVAIGLDRAPVLNDTWREGEAARLRRLHAEVARIAEVLTRLAGEEPGLGSTGDVEDRRRSYDPGPGFAGQVSAHEVRRMIRARRIRDQFFGEGLFEDPAWDMLLDLYAAQLEGARVSVSSLCIAAAVAPTTALRWIAKLTESGLFIRHPDPLDRRRAFITLAPRAGEAMRGYMLAVTRADPRHA